MGDIRGFLKVSRSRSSYRDPRTRTGDYKQVLQVQPLPVLRQQGARCMDCGIPFCHQGCPLGNLIPDWNDLVYRDQWREAIDQLHATNNFPEFTGTICPAPCEAACVLDINDDPVTIKHIELSIIDRAFAEGWVVARPPEARTGKTVAVVGSGPTGMAVAAELNKAGHSVTVFERDEGVGGLMRFGVPDFKLEKWVIDRRVRLLEEEGVVFRCGVDVGADVTPDELREEFDAVVIAIGARVHRRLEVPGSDLRGVELAMDYLYDRNRWVAEQEGRPALTSPEPISAAGQHVVVVGGGDTGMDCIANAHREGALSVTMLDTYPEVPEDGRYPDTPWPEQPKRTRHTYALEEGGDRRWETAITAIRGEDGRVTHVEAVRVRGRGNVVAGTEFVLPADLVLVAIGFTQPEPEGLLEQLGVEKDRRGNVRADVYATSVEGVFAAGDARRGQSLVVWAIAEGRECARAVDKYLGGDGAITDTPPEGEAVPLAGALVGTPPNLAGLP